MRSSIIGLSCVVLLSGCGGATTQEFNISPQQAAQERMLQQQLALELSDRYWNRLFRVSQPILRNNVELCGEKVAPTIGLRFTHVKSYDRSLRDMMIEVGKVDRDDRVSVLHVLPDSAAERIGFQRGDVILRFDQAVIAAGRIGVRQLMRQFERWDDRVEETGDRTAQFVIERNGQVLVLEPKADIMCSSQVNLIEDDAINAFADGKDIYINMGMMRFVETEEQLAVVVGHELAHNTMLHIENKQANAMGGMIVGAVIGGLLGTSGLANAFGNAAAQAFSVEFETEADYVGLYMLERSGQKIDDAPNFWRRMGAANVTNITYSSTHPTTAERTLVLDQVTEEIREKREDGVPMVPNPKEDSSGS